MADAALRTEAPNGAENISTQKPAVEASKPAGPTEARIVQSLNTLGGPKTPDPDRSLLSIMTAIGGESTLANEKALQQNDKQAELNFAEKMTSMGGESTLAGEDSLKQLTSDKTNVIDLKTGAPLTEEQVGNKAHPVDGVNPKLTEIAANDNEKLDPNAETKEQKMQRLSQELSDNRKKYVESTRWLGASTANEVINKDDAERAYKDSLKSYREAKMADVQEQIASDPSLQEKPEGSDKSGADKLIEDTLREFTIGEFKNLQEDDVELRLQKRKELLGESGSKAIDWVKSKLESYRKMKTWKKIGLSVTANILTGGSASIVLRGLGIASSSAAYKEMMEGKADTMRDKRWENVNQEGLNEAQTESGMDLSKVNEFLNKQSDGMADKFQSYKKMRFARTVGSIGAAVGLSVGGSYAFRELMQTDTAQMVKEKAYDVAQSINQELNPFHIDTVASAEPRPGDQVLPPEPADGVKTIAPEAEIDAAGGSTEGIDKIAQLEQLRERMLEQLDQIQALKDGLTPGTEEFNRAVALENQTMTSLAKLQGEIAARTIGPSLRDAGESTFSPLPKPEGVYGAVDKMDLSEKTGDVWGEKLPGAEDEISSKVSEEIKSGVPDIKAEAPIDSATASSTNADSDKAKNMFAVGEGGVTSDAKVDSAATETFKGKIHDVQKGENIWKIVDKQLDSSGLGEGQKTHAIDEIKDRLGKMSADELKAMGISSGDINKLSTEDNIDVGKILGDKGEIMSTAVENANKLSADQIASIEQNNDKLNDFFKAHKDIPATDENIDKVLQGKGDTLTDSADEAVKKAGEYSGNIRDLEQKAKDVLGQYGQRRAGESDDVYATRVNFAARQMGVDLYSSAPKAEMPTAVPDGRSGAGASEGLTSGTAGKPEGPVDWSRPPDGYEPRFHPPTEQTPPQEPVKTYIASTDTGRATAFKGYGIETTNDGRGNVDIRGNSGWEAHQGSDGSSRFRNENISSSRDATGNVTIDRPDGPRGFVDSSRGASAYNALSSEPKTGSDEIKIPDQITDKEARAQERAARRAAKQWKRFAHDTFIKDAVKGSKFWSKLAGDVLKK